VAEIEIPWYEDHWDPEDSPLDDAANRMGRRLAKKPGGTCEDKCKKVMKEVRYFNGVTPVAR
jgi:hypothetical protein